MRSPRRGRARAHHACSSSMPTHPSFEHDTTSRSASSVVDHLVQRVGHRAPRVEDRARRRVTKVVALARDAVVRRRIPRDQRLPHVVVGRVAVLVVGRIEVGEVEVLPTRRRHRHASPWTACPAPASSDGTRKLERCCERGAHCLTYAICTPVVESTRSAASIEARQQDRLVRVAAPLAIDGVADGVDACRVVRLEVARLCREDVGHVPRLRERAR